MKVKRDSKNQSMFSTEPFTKNEITSDKHKISLQPTGQTYFAFLRKEFGIQEK